MYVDLRVRVCMCVRACMRACVCVCVRAHTHTCEHMSSFSLLLLLSPSFPLASTVSCSLYFLLSRARSLSLLSLIHPLSHEYV